jgi:hypothetical protein
MMCSSHAAALSEARLGLKHKDEDVNVWLYKEKTSSSCMWLRPNLASPGVATSDVNNIVFVCGLAQASLHREQLYGKNTSSSLHVV